ncbi:MAG TPA: hypothetical protein VGS07_22030 [Thermoanaerobaculia bacterium]|jgi:hypothetical protein|nr:hypothetical protein [Thermoanaerobaculia bacterium]
MTTDYIEIQLDQYRTLRAEAISHVADTRKLEVQVISVLGALYVWLATHPSVPEQLWFIGVPISVIGGLRALILHFRVLCISAYLRGIEEKWFGGTDTQPLPGWERYRRRNSRAWLSPIAVLIWLILIAASVYAPKHLRPAPADKPTEIRFVP